MGGQRSRALPGHPHKILIIKWSALGDVVIATALMEDIARAYPDAEIHLNTQPNCVGLFAGDPRFGEVFAIDVRSKKQRWKNTRAWLKKVRDGHYDMLIDLQRSDHSRLLLALLWLSGGAPRVRLGNLGGFPYTHQPVIRDSQHHAFAMMRSVLESAGIPTRTPHPVFHHSPQQYEQVRQIQREQGLVANRYVVLLPGSHAAGTLKRWGVSRFRELAQLLHAQGIPKIVLVGGPDEIKDCDEIAEAGDFIVNLNNKLQLLQIAPLCEGALAIIGNDTGTAHFAAEAVRPMLVLCGPTDPRRVKPIGGTTIAIQAQLPCINCYAKQCRNPDFHACMKAITPDWVASCVPLLSDGTLKADHTYANGLNSF